MTKSSIAAGRILAGKKIAVLGYGSQGRAQALNLRDSGFVPAVGLPAKSKSRKQAKSDGFELTTPVEAVRDSQVIAVLIPDHLHKELFDAIPVNYLRDKTFIFAHGLSVAFGLVKLSPQCDFILVAPHGPGVRLRERFLNGESFTAFIAVGRDHTGAARHIAIAYAGAIGCDKPDLFESTFREEAVGDIFGEQAALCGGLVGLLESGFETLVRKGHSPRSAYLECVHQIDLIVDLIKRFGTAGMFERISKTAAFGALSVKNKLFDGAFHRKLDKLYAEIESGKFARSLTDAGRRGFARLGPLLTESENSPLQKVHDSLATEFNRRRRRPRTRGRKGYPRSDAGKSSRDT